VPLNDEKKPLPVGEQLVSLRPEFDGEEHSPYVSRIESALKDESDLQPLNIALTGSYGSGKSSILAEIARRHPKEVINVSIPAFFSPGDSSETQEVRKEIVKQLLYREKPSRLAGSRFRRAEKLTKRRVSLIALVGAGFALVIMYLSGASRRLEDLLAPSPLATAAMWLSGFILLSALFIGAQYILHNRIRISGIAAGPTTIVTGKADESYFDQYLDEIVYFFSATECSIAIFEDLDRFENVDIFEELRELNVLLNNSKQVGKRVRFVYALRDSIFDRIGDAASDAQSRSESTFNENPQQPQTIAPTPSLVDSTQAASARAKFFDLVIPVVPFATRRTSIDLWDSQMLPESSGISSRALSIASRHVQDMRVIKLVRNEYDVFAEIIDRNGITELTPDGLFALMLYKAVHLDDFEKIRSGESRLDRVEALRRRVIRDTARDVDARVIQAESTEHQDYRRDERARVLGETLRVSLESSFRFAKRVVPNYSFTVDSTSFTSEAASTVEFWKAVVKADGAFEVVLPSGSVSLTAEDVTRLTGDDPLLLSWKRKSATEDVRGLTELRKELLHAEIAGLANMSGLVLEPGEFSFRSIVSQEARSGLAEDLLFAGLLDRNFSLYVTRFYGRVITKNAMNFVIHVVQPGIVDIDADLSAERDVEAVIQEAGADFLGTRSALNVHLFDALAEDTRLDDALEVLASGSADSTDFLNAYVLRGHASMMVVRRLAGRWSGVLQWIGEVSEFDPATARLLLNAALEGLDQQLQYTTSPNLSDMLRMTGDLSVLSTSVAPGTGDAIARVFESAQVQVIDLAALVPSVREAIVRLGLFKTSAANLAIAFGVPAPWSLDDLLNRGERSLVRHLLREWDLFRAAMPRRNHAVATQSGLEELLGLASESGGPSLVNEILKLTAPGVVVDDLSRVNATTWPSLLSSGRASPTAVNYFVYQEQFGVDETLESSIRKSQAVHAVDALPQPERRELARELLGRETLAPSKRSRFVRHLQLDPPLAASEIPRQRGEIYAYLVRDGLIADSAVSFDALASLGWETRLAFIKRARGFATYAAEVSYLREELVWLFKEASVKTDVKVSILRGGAKLGEQLNARVATAATLWLSSSRTQIQRGWLDMLAAAGADGRALAQVFEKVNDNRVIEILALTKEPWVLLSAPTRRRPSLPSTNAVLALLIRLQGMGLVTSWRTQRGGKVQVSLRHE